MSAVTAAAGGRAEVEVTCLHPDCDLEVWARGLCQKHHQEANRLIRSKLTTDAELVARGMMLPPYANRRRMRDWLQKDREAKPGIGPKPRAGKRCRAKKTS